MTRAVFCVTALLLLLAATPIPIVTSSPAETPHPSATETASPRPIESARPAAEIHRALTGDLVAYLKKRSGPEHITNVSLAIGLHDGDQFAVAAGRVSADPQSRAVTPQNIYQIGSNTKAFVAATILQLEAEHRLSIDDKLGKWLPQYRVWRDVTIQQLLNMTSGIPSYDNEPTLMRAYARHPERNLPAQLLVAAVYPEYNKPHAGQAWSYSNTNYILAQLIIEKATHDSLENQLRKRFFVPLALNDTYYSDHLYPRYVTDRTVSGYFFNSDPGNEALQPIFGKDVRTYSLSWAQGAGAIVATPLQVVRWVRALYSAPVLATKQRNELLAIVSNTTGDPIPATNLKDPRGFGLGVGQLTNPQTGTIWYYEGETLGYRVLYGYFPKQDAVIVLATNSQPKGKDDHIGPLLARVYETMVRLKAF